MEQPHMWNFEAIFSKGKLGKLSWEHSYEFLECDFACWDYLLKVILVQLALINCYSA